MIKSIERQRIEINENRKKKDSQKADYFKIRIGELNASKMNKLNVSNIKLE